MKYKFGHLEEISELYNIIETLGGLVKTLDEYLFLSLEGKCKLDDLNDFFAWKFLIHTRQRESLEVLFNIIGTGNKLAYLGVTGNKQSLM